MMEDLPSGWEDYLTLPPPYNNQSNNIDDTDHHNLPDPVFQRPPGREQEEPDREAGQDNISAQPTESIILLSGRARMASKILQRAQRPKWRSF